ncbi:glycosylphosphatidylinositol anchor biosynthesis [Microsporum audouinii]
MASSHLSPPSSPVEPQSKPASQPPNSPPTLAAPIPPPVPVETHPNRAGLKSRPVRYLSPDPSRLAPEDAYFTSPPRLRPGNVGGTRGDGDNTTNDTARLLNRSVATPAALAALRIPPAVPGLESKPAKDRRRDRSRRKRKGQWKKLLWVKQSYPDNYTDTETFLDHLQRNPRLQPYDFWPLVADFTVIVQHVCSVIIFVCCFTVIFQERVSPITVVSCGSICTILGWVVWDYWVAKDGMEAAVAMEATKLLKLSKQSSATTRNHSASSCSNSESLDGKENDVNNGLGLSLDTSSVSSLPSRESSDSGSGTRSHSISTSATSIHSEQSAHLSLSPVSMNASDCPLGVKSNAVSYTKSSGVATPLSPLPTAAFIASRHRQMFTTAKSALLIFCTLRGLSPILKSLTKSTTSDSIWAMSCWLMAINIFFFDYGSGEKNIPVGGAATANFPASLSTNAALMASTVLASRLKSTSHVFSLTLFSIEVFGLFPVFRRHLRSYSWRGHVSLTVALVLSASASVGITLRGGLSGAIIGILIGSPSTALIMGCCSWWLISLQRYKNVVIGPWDPAKPIIRRHWD